MHREAINETKPNQPAIDVSSRKKEHVAMVESQWRYQLQ